MNIPEDIKSAINSCYPTISMGNCSSLEEFDAGTIQNELNKLAAEYGYSLALPKIEEQQQVIDLLKQSNTYQLSHIGKLFADKIELGEENKRLKAEIERLKEKISFQ